MDDPDVELTVKYPDLVGKASLGKEDCRVIADNEEEE